MFHPNIFQDGTLCLDIIQDKWKPIFTVSTILTSIQVGCSAHVWTAANVWWDAWDSVFPTRYEAGTLPNM